MYNKNKCKLINELIKATDEFTQLMYFLQDIKDYKYIKLKIGKFIYNNGEWYSDIYCELKQKKDIIYDINFIINRIETLTLTENLIYGWELNNS